MKFFLKVLPLLFLLASCSNDDYEPVFYDNPDLSLNIPVGFPELNNSFYTNKPTKYGVALGEKLFHEKRFSADNTISCASCHIQSSAFADNKYKQSGIRERFGFGNTHPIQNII